MLFSRAHRILMKIDNMLDHKLNLKNKIKIEICYVLCQKLIKSENNQNKFTQK